MSGGSGQSTRASIAHLPDSARAVLRLLSRADGGTLPFAHAVLAFPPDAPSDAVRMQIWRLALSGLIELVTDTEKGIVSEVRLTTPGAAALTEFGEADPS